MCIKQAKTKKLEPITLALAETYIAVSIFTRESSYCFQRVLAIAILSVRLSHGWISQK